MILYGQTDVGKVRQTNQDSFRIAKIGKLNLAVVCDGMGGAAGGSTASRTACDVFLHTVKDRLAAAKDEPRLYETVLCDAVDAANAQVFALASRNQELAGMGTTLCAVLADENRFWAVSVGDSRIYMFHDNRIIQLSHDHSYVQALLDSGTITPDESKNHPNKNIITRAVGTQETVECDSFTMEFSADGLLLCSDGLTNFVGDDELNSDFMQYTNPEELAKAWIQSANAAGGGDNITAVIVRR
ncbi:MAG: Stp1/IreP family PP2C-type Ser/Thr phosphatase [Eubacteriales bacterium]